jgi:transposase
MQDRDTRAAIFRLHAEGHGLRTIARSLSVSRNTVRRVLVSGSAEVPSVERAEKAEPHEEAVRALYVQCRGNLVRVHEELAARGIALAYTTLTGFCRRHGIGQSPKEAAGHYEFEPGQEMQHDTSPHDVVIGGIKRRMQCASLVLCYSRMDYAQLYPRWTRFWTKVFLTEALTYFRGACGQCMIDNSSVIVSGGTGEHAVMAPEMTAFADRFGFVFRAHRLGDANRSARVERPFHYIENNFYAGRTFADEADANAQLRAWCERANAKPKRTIRAKPIELYATEQSALRPLPLHIPIPYVRVTRVVDDQGYINLHTNRYSVDEKLIDRELVVHETQDQIRLFDGHTLVCEHVRAPDGADKRAMLPEHERQRRRRRYDRTDPPLPEESLLMAASPTMARMVEAIKNRYGGRATRAVQRLHRMWIDYPHEPLDTALARALDHGLLDLERIEALVLQQIAGDFFRLPQPPEDQEPPS